MRNSPEQKYVIHQHTGLPVRLSPGVRRELRLGTFIGQVQSSMISRSPFVDQRSENDTLPINTPENIRLRRIAHRVSQELTSNAENLGAVRYCTVVHGSLSRGLVRHPSSSDPSDIDIDLVIEGVEISKEERNHMKENMYRSSEKYGARIDSYVWTIDQMRKDCGQYARLYLGASAYPITNKGSLWEEIVWTGIIGRDYSSQEPYVRKKIKKVLALISQGEIDDSIQQAVNNGRVGELTSSYLRRHGLSGTKEAQANGKKMLAVIAC